MNLEYKSDVPNANNDPETDALEDEMKFRLVFFVFKLMDGRRRCFILFRHKF